MYTIKTFNKIKNLLGKDFILDENAKDLNGEGEDVRVKGRSVGDALAERRFLGFIDTHGSFSPSSDDPLP